MNISLELQPCLKTKAGIGIYAYEITKALQRNGELNIKGDIFNYNNRNVISKDIENLNLSMNICRLLSYGAYRRVWNYVPIKYNKLFREKSDIYHFFDYIVPPRIEGKVITTIHDMTYNLYPHTMQRKTLNRIIKDIDYSVNRADKVITISENTKRDIINILNISSDKIELAPPGVDYSTFSRNYHDVRIQSVKVKYKLPKRYILYMGTLEPRKNIESIIEAFNLFRKESDFDSKDIKLVIAGKKGWLYNNIFSTVRELSLEKEIIFTDYVDEIDKPIIYKLALLFMFPSLYEGFGIPVLEAMASSVPVITSNTSSLPEVAGNAAILVKPKDIISMASSIHSLLTDEDLRNNLIYRGNIQAKRFSWYNSADKIYEIYKSLK